MTNTDILPRSDADLKTWAIGFVNAAEQNAADLGINGDELDALKEWRDGFADALVNVSAKRTAYTTAVGGKNASRAALESGARVVVRRIQANPNVTDETRKTLGIGVRDRVPSSHAPLAPTGLVVNGLASGTNVLKWNRGANAGGVLFVVEAKIGAATEFALVDVVKPTRYSHENQTPGVKAVYRIRARRGQTLSNPSSEGAVYAG